MLTFQDQLKRIYQNQNQIIPLIQGLEDEIPQQLLESDYIKLKMSIRGGQNRPNVDITDLETIFDLLPIEEAFMKRPIHKLLIVGGAGTGKSTLTQYIAYKWSQGELWNDKFDYVYKVSFKTLLTRGWDYSHGHGRQDENDDLLKQLVYYHLRATAGEFCKLEDMPWKTAGTLLLLDGFDEVAHEMNGIYKTLFESMFNHENILVTSRPNAVGKDMTDKFNRTIENSGFGPAGINEYLTNYFKNNQKKGQSFDEYLRANSFIKEACHTPVIIAMLCFIWSEGDSNQALQRVSNISDLYHQVVDHLGWRYYANQTSLSEQDRYELSSKWRGGDIPLDELLVLQHTAYKRMTGGGIEASDDQRPETLIIPGTIRKGDKHGVSIQSSINYLTDELKRLMPTINKVYKYGLLKPEGVWITNKNPSVTDLQSYNFSFIHQSFQEFLTAQYLAKKLILNEKRENIANFIAQHRNEPYYLNTLKFMAGIFSTAMRTAKDEKVEEGFLAFWDAIMCNPDGILEFGEEMKITLLIHLLTQTTKEEKRRPNMEIAVRLIDSVVLRDLPKWSFQLRESDYLSDSMREVLIEYFLPSQNGRLLLKEKAESPNDIMEIICGMINKFSKEDQEKIFERVLEFQKGQNEIKWQERKRYIEAIIAICRKSDLDLDEFNQNQLSDSLFGTVYDDNLGEVSLKSIQELACKPRNSLFIEKLKGFLKEELNVRIDVAKLLTITDLILVTGIQDNQLIETVIKSLVSSLNASSYKEEKPISDRIKEIVKISCKNNSELVKTVINSLTPVLNDSTHQSLKKLKLDTITELTKIGWKNDSRLVKDTLHCLDPFLKDLDRVVRESASNNMTKLTTLGWKNYPQLIRKTLESLAPVLQDPDWDVRKSASHNFLELVKRGCEDDNQLIGNALDYLAQLFEDPNPHVKKSAADIVIELATIGGGVNDALLFKNTFACLSTFFGVSDFVSRKSASFSAIRLVKISCKNNIQLSLDFLKYLAPCFGPSDSGPQRSCSEIVTELIDINESSYNQLIRDMSHALVPLLQNYSHSVRETAYNSITQLMEINDNNKTLLVRSVLNSLVLLLEDPDFNIRNSILDTVLKFIEKNGHDGLQLAGDILKNSDWDIRYLSSKAIENLERSQITEVPGILDELNKQLRNYDSNLRKLASDNTKLLMGIDAQTEAQMFSDLFKTLALFLNYPDADASVKNSASKTIITLMEISGHHDAKLLEDLFKALKSVLQDVVQREPAFENLKALLEIRSLHPELAEKFWKELAPLLINSKKEVKLLVSSILIRSMTFFNRNDDVYTKRVGIILGSLSPLLKDSSEEIQSSAIGSLNGLIEIYYSGCTGMIRELLYDFSRLIENPHPVIQDIAFSSIQELVKMGHQGQVAFANQVLNKFKPLLPDQSVDLGSRVFRIIINLTKMGSVTDPQIIENVLKRLSPLLQQHQKWYVQKSALNDMTEFIKIGWENGTLSILRIQEILNSMILPLFKCQFSRELVSDKVIELAELGQENNIEFIRDIFADLALLLIDPDRNVKTAVSDCMTELVKIGSQKDTQFIRYVLDSLTPVFKEFDWQIKEPVSAILIETMNISPQYDHTELCQILFTFLTSLLEDPDWYVRSSAADKIIKLMELKKSENPLVRDAIEISIGLLQHSNPDVADSSSSLLKEIFLQILSRNPTDLTEYFNYPSRKTREILISGLFDCLKNYVKNFELFEEFFKDPKAYQTGGDIQEKLFKGKELGRIGFDIQRNFEKLQEGEISKAEFDEQLSDLQSLVISEINQINTLKGPQIIELALVLIGKERAPEDDSDRQNLTKMAKEVLNFQVNYLNTEGLKWIHDNHEKLISLSPEAKSFDRKVCHKLLEQEQMTPLELSLLIKQGLSVSLTRDGEIIFEGKRHKLKGDYIPQTLEEIAKIIISQQQDIFALQYKQHQPIFTKSNVQGGMKEAAVDLKKVESITDKRRLLKNDSWLLTVLNSLRNPQFNIILLEKRNAFGDHFIFRFNDQKVFRFHPNERPELEEIFGSYIHGEAYQGELRELTEEVGQKLFESRDKNLASQIKGKVLSHQKYFHQELLGGGNEDRNSDVEQELACKLNHYRQVLERQLFYLNSEAQKRSIREYFDGFVSTFDTVYSSSKVIVAGQVEIKAGTDYFNLVNLFIQLLSLDPFGIGPLLAAGLDSLKKHFEDNKIINRALSIVELAPDHVELYDLANKTALSLIWHRDNTKHFDYTQIIFNAREDDPANNRFNPITRFVLEQFDKLKGMTKDYRLLRNAFLKEIAKTPAWKLGSNDANKIIKQWIEFHDLHSNLIMDYNKKSEKIAEIAITTCFYVNQQQIPTARRQGQFRRQQIPAPNINRQVNPSHKTKKYCSIF